MKTIQERILEYLEFKGITPYRFCKDLGLSMGYLDKKGAIGTDKYLKIIEYYKDLSPEWLLMEKGERLKNQLNNAEDQLLREPQPEEYQKQPNQKDQEIAYLKNENKMQQEIIDGLKRENEVLRILVPELNSKKNIG